MSGKHVADAGEAAVLASGHGEPLHFFTACRPDRPPSTYRIDVESGQWLDAVPVFRYRCGLDGEKIIRPGWSTPLEPEQLALVRLVDGRRTIREIIAAASGPAQVEQNPIERERFAGSLFESLVNRDFIVLGLAGSL